MRYSEAKLFIAYIQRYSCFDKMTIEKQPQKICTSALINPMLPAGNSI
jgi:hypothetical protein